MAPLVCLGRLRSRPGPGATPGKAGAIWRDTSSCTTFRPRNFPQKPIGTNFGASRSWTRAFSIWARRQAWRRIRPILPPGLGGDDRGDRHRSLRAPNISWQGPPTLARLSRSSKLPSSRPIAQSARHLARDRSGRDAKAARRARCDQAPSRRPLSHPVGSRRLDDLRSTGRSRRGDLLRRRPRTRRPSGRAVTAPSSYARRARSAGRDDSRSGAVMAPSCACLAPRQRALCGLTGFRSGCREAVARACALLMLERGPSRRRQIEDRLMVSTDVSHL
jgi:hypothetical protein